MSRAAIQYAGVGDDGGDHDGKSNIEELSRSALPAAAQPEYAGVSGLSGLYVAVNPYNPCLPDPDPHYTTCPSHPMIGNSDYAPFTSDGDNYFVLN